MVVDWVISRVDVERERARVKRMLGFVVLGVVLF